MDDGEGCVEIRRYLQILESRKWVVIVTAIVTLIVVTLGSFRMTRIYSASAMVRVAAGLNSSVSYVDLNYSERLIRTYVQLLKSRPFLEEVITRLDLDVGPQNLAGAIKVEPLTDTELIRISVESARPQDAAEIANALGALLVEQEQKMYYGQGKSAREILQGQVTILEDQLRQDRALLAKLSGSTPNPDQSLEASIQDLTAKVRSEEQTYTTLLGQYDKARVDEAVRANSIGIVEPAVAPGAPSKPNLKLNIVLGALVGVMGGIGLAFLFENLSPMIFSTDDLEKTAGAPLLGQIPSFKIQKGTRQETILLNHSAAQSPAGEALRVLSANLLALAGEALPTTGSGRGRPTSVPSVSGMFSEARPKTVLVSSVEPRAGKTTILINLAVAIAQAGRQVVLVDGDLRKPKVHKVLDVREEPGLSDVILDPSQLSTALQETEVRGVRVLACGSAQPDPAVILSAPAVRQVIHELAEEADIVLWDSPPIFASADATLLARMVDGVVLLVGRTRTQREAVQAACQQLADVKAKLLGIIVNRADEDGRYKDY